MINIKQQFRDDNNYMEIKLIELKVPLTNGYKLMLFKFKIKLIFFLIYNIQIQNFI